MHTTCKITPYPTFSNEIASCGLFSTFRHTDIFPCPKKPDTASAPVWTCSGMITFAISTEHSSLQSNTAFFFFSPKKDKNDMFVERWAYKIKNKLKPDQNEFLIELAQA